MLYLSLLLLFVTQGQLLVCKTVQKQNFPTHSSGFTQTKCLKCIQSHRNRDQVKWRYAHEISTKPILKELHWKLADTQPIRVCMINHWKLIHMDYWIYLPRLSKTKLSWNFGILMGFDSIKAKERKAKLRYIRACLQLPME